jgi:DNA-binding NarL/FixJ family response regulator
MLGSDAVSEEKAARFNKIADMLDKGFTVRDICARLKVSSKTVSKVNKAISA